MFRIIFIYFPCTWCNPFFCIIGTLAQKKCDLFAVYDEHVAHHQIRKSFSHYIPKQSCFICLEPQCQLGTEGCQQIEFPELPLYNNMLEFGFLGNDLPQRGFIRVPMTKTCYFQIEMQITFGGEDLGTQTRVVFYFWQCQYRFHLCESQYDTRVVPVERTECVFVSVMLSKMRPNQIFVSVSHDCINLPSAIRTEERFLDIKNEECKFKSSFEKTPSTNFEFVPAPNRRHDGIVMVLPCSSGGYVVNPVNGRFVYDYKCKSLFFPEVHGNAAKNIIEEMYNKNEHLVFPNSTLVSPNREDNFRPLYIERDGIPKRPDLLQPIVKPRTVRGRMPYRDRCDLYVELPYQTIDGALINFQDYVLSSRLVDRDTTIPFDRTVKTTLETTTTTTPATETETEKLTEVTTEARTPTTTTATTTTTTTTTTTETTSGVTFFPDVDPIKQMVIVTYKNLTSDILVTFEREQGVFSNVNTIAPGVPPPPTPMVPLWIPDYEDLFENRIRHGRRTPRRAANYSRHHKALIRFLNKTRRKRDNIFARFDRERKLEGVDYFGNLTSIDMSKGTNLLHSTILWIYKLLFLCILIFHFSVVFKF